ncbi:MAG: flagellar protein [Clostridiales bacterium]|nr:flagellar protein [Clostridiales bacterium]
MDINNKFSQISINQIANQYLSKKGNVSINNSDASIRFEDILNQKKIQNIPNTEGLKFSKHATSRLEDRNINLTREQFERLENGTKKAEEKGINESLMIMDNMAFIVNVKNNTVVTAMDQESSKENVFTNIDGAVIV